MTPSEAIEHLQRAGLTEKAIAIKVDSTQPTINRIRRGSQPGFDLGKALVDLAVATPLEVDPDHDRIGPVEGA